LGRLSTAVGAFVCRRRRNESSCDKEVTGDLIRRFLVDIDSGSYNKSGIDQVGSVVRRFLEGHGLTVEALPQSRRLPGPMNRRTIFPSIPKWT